MKRFSILLAGLLMFASPAFAATITADFTVSLQLDETAWMAPIKITAIGENDITSEHGINLLIPQNEEALWNESEPIFTGSARDEGKVNLNVKPEYSLDRKVIHIPVQEDWDAGNWLQVQGVEVRSYDESVDDVLIAMDIDGDLVADATGLNGFKVGDEEGTDDVDPYPVGGVSHVLNADGSLDLSWVAPPDYDFTATIVSRTKVVDGNASTVQVYNDFLTTYKDTGLSGATEVTYTLMARDDEGNQSASVEYTVDLTAEEEVEEVVEEEPVEEESENEEPIFDDVADQVFPLYGYYKLRYAIKCKPSGVPVPENDSPCLWARIDLVYTQEVTGETDIDVELSETDLDRMATRRKWPEMRYQDNCIDAEEAASYCSALGKALDRTSYFLD